MMSRFVVAVILATAGGSSIAQANVEVGGLAGVHLFSETNGIGVDDSPTADSQKNSALFAMRLGVYFGFKLGVEIEGGYIPGEARSMLFDVTNIVARAQVVYQFRAEDANNKTVPFVLIGGGLHSIVKSGNTDFIKEDNQPVPHLGGGAKYRADNGWGVRLEARLLLPPSSASGAVTADFEALVSVFKEFGRAKPTPKKELPPPPKVDEDPDKDGLAGAADKCPEDAEDKDGFQDDDGCPDLDNDGDGVADTADKCAMEPEDKDSFQDDDGCPDLDNDADGFPDAADKCAGEAETKNGFRDDDGCPDEIPDQLKPLLAPIQGLNFKVTSADLAPGSNKPLDAIVAVLTEIKDVKLEIGAHTDDQPIAKNPKFPDNVALSQARAETVKAYLVSKGIDDKRLVTKGYADTVPLEDTKPLKGAQLNAARIKNRRVELKIIVEGMTMAAPEPAPAPAPAPAP